MTSFANTLAVTLTTAFLLTVCIHLSYSCNEQVCASIVSKCMLTQSCKCDLKNCSCCKECFNCLNYLYNECCSCVDMCPRPNDTRNALSKKSHVEDLEEVPGLFKALTEGHNDNDDDKWTVFTFPVDFDATFYGGKNENEYKYILHSADQELDTNVKPRENIVTHNCTVVYISQCLSWNKCKQNCQSMGATSYRWFHDSCCECVGSTCINYGINESRCTECPEVNDDDLEEMPHGEEYDFGEGRGAIGEIDKNL